MSSEWQGTCYYAVAPCLAPSWRLPRCCNAHSLRITYSATSVYTVYVCTVGKQEQMSHINKQYNKCPDPTVDWDMPCVHVTDAAEIKQVSWIILNVKSHSDSVPENPLGFRSAQSSWSDQLRPSWCWWCIHLVTLHYLLADTHCHAFCIN